MGQNLLLLLGRQDGVALDPFRVLLHDRERMKLDCLVDLRIRRGKKLHRNRQSDRRARRAIRLSDHISWNDVRRIARDHVNLCLFARVFHQTATLQFLNVVGIEIAFQIAEGDDRLLLWL